VQAIDPILWPTSFTSRWHPCWTTSWNMELLEKHLLTSTLLSIKNVVSPTSISLFSCIPMPAFRHPSMSIVLYPPSFLNENDQPDLHNIIKTHMVHGPCSIAHYSPCLKHKNECSKGFPKPFQQETEISGVSYVKTRRHDTGISVNIHNTAVDNQSIVSYPPFLSKHYQAHINIKCTTGFNAIKYLYKVSWLSDSSASTFLC
jgi:hypothetical protein